MVKVTIIVVPEGAELADEASETPFVYTAAFPTVDDVLDWFGEASRFSDLNKVPHRMHPIGEGC